MPFSFWEQNTFIKSPDIVIIGSGIVGLNAAIELKLISPNLHVLVLERGMLPYGASTRNAGFACYGSVSELLSDLETSSEEKVFSLVERRWNGLQQLRKRIGDKNMNYETLGGYEVFTPGDKDLFEECRENIERFNSHLSKITGEKNNYRVADERILSFGLGNVNHLIVNTGEGQIDTGKMMKSLIGIAREHQVEILNGASVSDITDDTNHVDITLKDMDGKNSMTVRSKRVLVCVNGFARKFLPDLDVRPARAQVLVTSPIQGLKIRGSFHYDRGFYYFRNVGDRLLFGGARNLDMEGETTEEMTITPMIQLRLESLLKSMILPQTEFEIEMRWSGIMGLGSEKNPIIRQTSKNIFCAVRMGGMGIAIGTLVGKEAAGMINRT